MANRFNQHFDELTNKQDRGQEFKQRIDNLPVKNWEKEISKLSKEFGLNTAHVMKEIKDMLVKSLDGEELSKELDQDLESFKSLYQKTKIKAFKESEDILQSIKTYIDKVKRTTEKRLASVLFAKPTAVNRISRFQEIKDEAILESNEYTDQEKERQLLTKIKEILEAELLDTEIIPAIKEAYFHIYKKRLVTKTLYKTLGLNDNYISQIKELSIILVSLLVKIKTNPEDDHAKAYLEREIRRMLNPDTDAPQELQAKPSIKVVGHVHLSEKDTNRFHRKQEIMQAATTDPLDIVGKRMSLDTFLGAAGMDYNQILEHIKDEDPIPARYLSHNEKFKGKFSDKFDMHFFTIGQEDKGDGNTPLINVSILVPKEKRFHEGEIYKIRLKNIDAPKESGRSQTRNIRGDLVVDLPELVGSGSPISENIDPKQLLELQSKYQNN